MTVAVTLRDDTREAATAASRTFTAPGWEPTPVPEGTEGWISFSDWARGGSAPNLSAAYAEMAKQGACPIEAGLMGALADNECEHERLPTDTTPPCGCWPGEVTKDPPFTLKEEPMPPIQVAQQPQKAGTQVAELTPFIANLVAELDAEIAKLSRVRDALVNG